MVINLSLVSHTNVGKTTLARTLLRRDIGEPRDRAHVTETADAHELLITPEGDELRLWDTPGLGDSARLLQRLRASANPLGWLQTQVWDRFTDRPFYSSQTALKAVREHCDLMLYLVSAAEGPESSGYVAPEMQILGWMDKPVLVLLNQTGAPVGPEATARELAAWRAHLQPYPWVKDVLSLDAFNRCWVQEDALLAAAQTALPTPRADAMARLRTAWRSRNLEVLDAAVELLARPLAQTAIDSETLATPRDWRQRLGGWIKARVAGSKAELDPEIAAAMQALAQRYDARIRAATNELIRLHGLSGQAENEIPARLAAAHHAVDQGLDPSKAGLAGAVVSGALGGLAADLAAGGLTLGMGALVGGVVGLLGAAGAAQAYNLARGTEDGRVRWSHTFLTQRLEVAVLRYLAVAHFGRGRGEWVQGEDPRNWMDAVHELVAARAARLESLWTQAQTSRAGTEAPATLIDALRAELRALVSEALTRLYPEARSVLEPESAGSRSILPGDRGRHVAPLEGADGKARAPQPPPPPSAR